MARSPQFRIGQVVSLPRDPRTDDEWQEAVDIAHGLLAIDSARMYGLITGGPEANARRCEEILKRGAERGIRPRKGAIEEIIRGLV